MSHQGFSDSLFVKTAARLSVSTSKVPAICDLNVSAFAHTLPLRHTVYVYPNESLNAQSSELHPRQIVCSWVACHPFSHSALRRLAVLVCFVIRRAFQGQRHVCFLIVHSWNNNRSGGGVNLKVRRGSCSCIRQLLLMRVPGPRQPHAPVGTSPKPSHSSLFRASRPEHLILPLPRPRCVRVNLVQRLM